jgi:deferrochelatase/peroxidase EfeB
MPAFYRSNIQSLLFAPHSCAYSRHFLFRCADPVGAKQFLAEWLPRVSYGEANHSSPGPFVHIAVSWHGLNKIGAFTTLGGQRRAEWAFPVDFMDPPSQASLRAYGVSSPENWWNQRFKSSDIDLTMHVYCTTEQMLEETTGDIRESARRTSVDELVPTKDDEAITGRVLGTGLPGLRKFHFGYSDGFSQPRINWDNDPALNGPAPSGRIAYPRGHFVIDEWDENAQSFPREEPWRGLVRHGSYAALVWVHQDVAAFNRFLRENARKIAPLTMSQKDAEELLAAKMMGRWRDGTPLVLSPNVANVDLAEKDFDYSQDQRGERCPMAAHIRIVNGRDQLLDFTNQAMFPAGFPRVLRRGSTYGPWLEGENDDGLERGIFGMFICANINQQFYSLMRWIGRTNHSDVYTDQHGQDPLFASRSVPDATDRFTIPSEDVPTTLQDFPDFIRIQGVAIVLLPSLSTLRQLAS